MIDHVWTVLCSKSAIDIESNNVSILDVIEQISIPGEPKPDGVLPMSFEIISLWIRSEPAKPEQGIERIIFVTPSHKSSIVTEIPIELLEAERQRNRVKFSGLPISEEGRHYFNIEYKLDEQEWIKTASIPLTIHFEHNRDLTS